MKRKAFTLIELLVVVAIIAILSAILFPVFARVKQSANRSVCQSNLKQIGLSIHQYTQDFDDKLPSYMITNSSPLPDGNPSGGFWYWDDITFSYHKNRKLFFCPNGVDKINRHGSNYGVNYLVIAIPNRALYQISNISKTYMVFDCGGFVIDPAWLANSVLMNTTRWLPGMGTTTGPAILPSLLYKNDYLYGRHFKGINMLYVDGHVKWMKVEKAVHEAKKTSPMRGNWALIQ
jgi:prepilin-type N-terminal cleavage/methylation domain-containing protein/prepilin-type processing-associated H-X9-DG protein